MEKTIIRLMDNFFNDKRNIIARAKSLIELTESISKEKNKIKYLNQFFVKVDNMYSELQEEENFCFINEKAVSNYFCSILKICGYYPPTICLEQMNRIANIIVDSFYKDDVPNIISKEKIEEIISYLDNKYEFLEKFNPFTYSIIEYKNKNYNSLLGVHRFLEKEGFEYHLFLFDVKDNKSPVYIFFHELGHYIHSNITTGKLYIPEDIILQLKNNGINIESMEIYQKTEYLANILAIGLMVDSPYKEFIPAFLTLEKNKTIFKDIVDKLLILRK